VLTCLFLICVLIIPPYVVQSGIDTKFTLNFFFVCTMTDFSAGALPIGVKFCTRFGLISDRPFSYFGRIAPRTAEPWASTGVIWRDMLLAEALVFCRSFCLYGYGFLSRRFTDRREILHGGLAASQAGFLLFWGHSPRDGQTVGVNMRGVDLRSPKTANKSRIAQKLCFVAFHVN